MDCELKQCCRICAQKNRTLISIFGEEGLFRQLPLKLRYCLQIIVLETDNLPTTICWKCITKLEVCFELMQERIRGQNEFQRKLFSQQKLSMKSEHKELKMEDGDPEQQTFVDQETLLVPAETQQYHAASPDCQSSDHSKLCQCEQCVSQYGGLPLLAEAVDKTATVSNVSSSDPSNVTIKENKSGLLEGNQEIKQEPSEGIGPIRQTKKSTSCEFCGKVFSHTGDLNKHRRRHTGERPYPCTQCSKCFSHTSNLLRHQKIHSGEMPHQCPTCDRRFSRKDKMLTHIKNCHSRSNPETGTIA